MTKFDYRAPAELFTGRSARGTRPMRYHRFDSGAEAVRFAVETLTSEQLLAAVLKIDENRYRHGEIRAFYEASAYPLPRKKAEIKDATPAKTTATAEKKPAARKPAERKPEAKSKTAARKSAVKSKSAA
jgi:hypothetical protein